MNERRKTTFQRRGKVQIKKMYFIKLFSFPTNLKKKKEDKKGEERVEPT